MTAIATSAPGSPSSNQQTPHPRYSATSSHAYSGIVLLLSGSSLRWDRTGVMPGAVHVRQEALSVRGWKRKCESSSALFITKLTLLGACSSVVLGRRTPYSTFLTFLLPRVRPLPSPPLPLRQPQKHSPPSSFSTTYPNAKKNWTKTYIFVGRMKLWGFQTGSLALFQLVNHLVYYGIVELPTLYEIMQFMVTGGANNLRREHVVQNQSGRP